MTQRSDSDLDGKVFYEVTRTADAAFVLFEGSAEVKAGLAKALGARGFRVSESGDDLLVVVPGGQVDTLELARALREKRCSTAVVVPVARESRDSSEVRGVTAQVRTRAGKLTVALVPSVVALDGRRLPLTRSEERLLARLWAARGRAVPASELVSAVLPHEEASVKALRVHVSKLRPKLRALGLHIETLKGRGYRLEIMAPLPEGKSVKTVRDGAAPRYRRASSAVVSPVWATSRFRAPHRAQRARSQSPWWLAPVPLVPSRGARPA
jgi:hypothetical protein